MRVRALKDMYDNVSSHKEGEEFEYSGPPNPNLLPLDKPAKKADEPKAAHVEEDDDDEPGKKFSKHK